MSLFRRKRLKYDNKAWQGLDQGEQNIWRVGGTRLAAPASCAVQFYIYGIISSNQCYVSIYLSIMHSISRQCLAIACPCPAISAIAMRGRSTCPPYSLFSLVQINEVSLDHISAAVWTIVSIVDGKSEMIAHVQSRFGNLICLWHLFISTVEANLKS